jgi:hypothetical protein
MVRFWGTTMVNLSRHRVRSEGLAAALKTLSQVLKELVLHG